MTILYVYIPIVIIELNNLIKKHNKYKHNKILSLLKILTLYFLNKYNISDINNWSEKNEFCEITICWTFN